jgi:hypothetical protein
LLSVYLSMIDPLSEMLTVRLLSSWKDLIQLAFDSFWNDINTPLALDTWYPVVLAATTATLQSSDAASVPSAKWLKSLGDVSE